MATSSVLKRFGALQLLLISFITQSAPVVSLGLRTATKSGEDSNPKQNQKKKKYKFVLCPKSVDNIFFDESRDGCYDRARALGNVECINFGPRVFEKTGVLQANMIRELLNNNTDIDGLSISVRGAEFMRPVINEAMDRGIPVVTFDSDDPGSNRVSYIGTDNYFFGEQLGKVLIQIHPEPGTFAIISDTPQNIVDREYGLRDTLLRKGWIEVAESPQYEEGNGTLAIEQMRYVANTYPNITAVIPVMGAPMFLEDLWKELVEEFRGIIFVVADGLPLQLKLLSQNYGHGLVAQLPYEMGSKSVDTLLALKQAMEEQANDQRSTTTTTATTKASQVPSDLFPDFMGTNVLEHLQIPLLLPELIVDQNHLGKLCIIGYTLFAIIALTSSGCAMWTWKNRALGVVKIAQPGFLVMIAVGSLVMGATIIPLSFDDSKDSYNEQQGMIRCMSIPYCAFLGFTITFAALLAKTWRVNQLFTNTGQFQRVQVTAGQVARPFFVLFAANSFVLACWTAMDPLRYIRQDMPGTDGWNRVIATYGSCQSENSTPYVAVLGSLNLLVLGFANWQAYRARKIKSEFSEAHYIGVTMASMMQAALIGVPLVVLVKDLPQAFYLTLVFMIFTITMVILLLIFVPKIAHARNFRKKSRMSQKRVIQESIAESSKSAHYHRRQRSNSSFFSHKDDDISVQSAAKTRRSSIVTFRGVVDHDDTDGDDVDRSGSSRNRRRSVLENTTVQDFRSAAAACTTPRQQQQGSRSSHYSDSSSRDEEEEAAIRLFGEMTSSDDDKRSLDFLRRSSQDTSDRSSGWRASIELARSMQDVSNASQRRLQRQDRRNTLKFSSIKFNPHAMSSKTSVLSCSMRSIPSSPLDVDYDRDDDLMDEDEEVEQLEQDVVDLHDDSAAKFEDKFEDQGQGGRTARQRFHSSFSTSRTSASSCCSLTTKPSSLLERDDGTDGNREDDDGHHDLEANDPDGLAGAEKPKKRHHHHHHHHCVDMMLLQDVTEELTEETLVGETDALSSSSLPRAA